MQKLDGSFSSYVPKQVTKEQIDSLFKNGLKFSSEKIAKVCNDALLSLKPTRDGYQFNAEDLEIDPYTLIHVFKDIFNAKASVGLVEGFLWETDGLRLLRPDYQKKFQFNEKESTYIRKLIDSRHIDMNEAEGCIGIISTLDDDLHFSGFNQPEIDRFYKFIDSCQLEDYTMKELLEILPIVKYFRLENMRLQLLDQISNVLDETNFICLLKNQRAKDPDVDDLLYWHLVQNDKIDFSPFSFSDLIELALKIKEFKLEEMSFEGDLLEEMKKKIGQGTFSELAPLYLNFKELNMLDKISWTQDLLNEMKKKIEHNWAFIALCKDAVKTKDKDIKELIGSCFSSSTEGNRKRDCSEAWIEIAQAKF